MITEDYVSFETAKLLKEKGFNEYYPFWYNLDKPSNGIVFYEKIGWYGHNSYSYLGHNIISAPTLQMAMKWLREVHNITIGITFSSGIISYEIQKNGKFITYIGSSRTYEQMVEEAIKYCLENLI